MDWRCKIMNLQEFVNTYNGTTVGGGQCVALIKQYEQDVLGLVPQAVGNAHQYYDDFYEEPFLYENFDRISYNQNNLPQIGDIIIWSTAVGGGFGHIAIVYENITNTTFTSFDQNWNTPLKCAIENHKYNNILGWIRKKGTTPPSPVLNKSIKKWFYLKSKKININYSLMNR